MLQWRASGAVHGFRGVLQAVRNLIYDLGFYEWLVSLDVDDDVEFFFELTHSLIAAFGTC